LPVERRLPLTGWSFIIRRLEDVKDIPFECGDGVMIMPTIVHFQIVLLYDGSA